MEVKTERAPLCKHITGLLYFNTGPTCCRPPYSTHFTPQISGAISMNALAGHLVDPNGFGLGMPGKEHPDVQ